MKIGRIILSAVIAAGCLLGMVGCGGAKSSVGNIQPMVVTDGDTIAEITIEGYGTITAKLFPDLAPNAVENFRLLSEQGYYDGLKIHRVCQDSLIQGGSLNGDGTGGKALLNDKGEFDIETSPEARHVYGALCYANNLGKNTTQFFIVNNKQSQDIYAYDPAKILAEAAVNTELIAALGEDTTSPDLPLYTYKEKYYTTLADMLGSATTEVMVKYRDEGGLPLYDGGYTVFGQVIDGFDVLDKLNSAEVTVNGYGEKSRPVTDIIIGSVVITEFKQSTAEATTEAEGKETAETSSTAEAAPTTGEASATAEAAAPSTAEAIDTIESADAV